MSYIIETPRLIIKPVALDDAAFILNLINTPKYIANIADRGIRTIEKTQAYVKEKMLPQFDRLGYGNYVVSLKNGGIKIGTCGIYDRPGLEGVDIGFAFLPEYENHGYAYESALQLKQVVVKDFGITNIKGITLPSNKSSQKLLTKLGLKYVKMINLPDDDEELMLFEWNK